MFLTEAPVLHLLHKLLSFDLKYPPSISVLLDMFVGAIAVKPARF